ncbi:MAG: FAD-dependent monooxygenase, partial [Chloroflexota bacterium]
MEIVCIGGGPGGLFAALLLKMASPGNNVTVIDRNPRGATYGWGVVFSDETLLFLDAADGETHRRITEEFVHWEAIDIHFRGQIIRSGGHAFSGLSRRRLLAILQSRCQDAGVKLRLGEEVGDVSKFEQADLLIAADGVHSQTRNLHAAVFQPSVDTHASRYIWLGCHLNLDAFTFVFQDTPSGMFQIHAYPFEPGTSTVIVECSENTWRSTGLDQATESQSIEFCQQTFLQFLGGRPLLSNQSSWLNFVTLRNDTWRSGSTVLLGDAAHTAHFSIGSGTKMAMEDAIVLADCVGKYGSVPESLLAYEQLREPIVDRTQQAARDSSLWFENVNRYRKLPPEQFAFSLLTRSKRITYQTLALRDSAFSRTVDRAFMARSGATAPTSSPGLAPLTIRDITFPNRIVRRLEGEAHTSAFVPAQPGCAGDPDSGCLVTRTLPVSPAGRMTPNSRGLYEPAECAAWLKLIHSIHRLSPAKVGAVIGHAGPRASSKPNAKGIDLPITSGGWETQAASAIAYGPRSP